MQIRRRTCRAGYDSLGLAGEVWKLADEHRHMDGYQMAQVPMVGAGLVSPVSTQEEEGGGDLLAARGKGRRRPFSLKSSVPGRAASDPSAAKR